MKLLTNLSEAELTHRIEMIDAEIKRLCADLLEERGSLVRQLEKKTSTAQRTRYADCKSPQDAIELALKYEGDFKLTRDELRDVILVGGYKGRAKLTPPKQLVRVSINNHIDLGNLIEKNGKVGRPGK